MTYDVATFLSDVASAINTLGLFPILVGGAVVFYAARLVRRIAR